ncbi:MAG: tetratricopeptide repeat protein, partial [Candidatus Heimdallarchaeota archaeon]|nr:tetratricopeptide repeat protein [Candidatus Heimdallarchaeota archaeon]
MQNIYELIKTEDFNQALSLNDKLDQYSNLIFIYTLIEKGDYNKAWKELFSIIPENNKNEQIYNSCKAIILNKFGQYQKSFDISSTLIIDTDRFSGIMAQYSAMNGIMLHHENYLVEEYILHSMEIFEELNDEYLIASIKSIYGEYFQKNSSYDFALENYLESLDLFKNCNRKNSYYETLIKIASVQKTLLNYQSALEYYRDVLLSSNQYNIIIAYLQIASIYSLLNKDHQSYKYLILASEYATQNGNPYLITSVNDQIGYYYGKMEMYDDALEILQTNIQLKTTANIEVKITQFRLGWIYYKLREYRKALELIIYAMNRFDVTHENAYLIQGSLLIDNINLMLETKEFNHENQTLNFIIGNKELDLELAGSSIKILPEEAQDVLSNLLIPIDNIIIASDTISLEIRQLLINGFNLANNESAIDDLVNIFNNRMAKTKALFIGNMSNLLDSKNMKIIIYEDVPNVEVAIKNTLENDYSLTMDGNDATLIA